MRLACLPESYQRSRFRARWVDTDPLCRSPSGHPKVSGRLDLEGFTLPPDPLRNSTRVEILSQASAPLQSITNAFCASSARLTEASFTDRRTFRGSSPLRRFPSQEEPLLRGVPPHPVSLRPQGFAPSRRLAPPLTCRACFIPIPSLGFSLRGLTPFVAPYALSSAASPHDVVGLRFPASRPARSPPRLRGIHATKIPPEPLGFSQVPYGYLHGILPSGVFHLSSRFRCRSIFLLPSRALTRPPQADVLARTPGFLRPQAQSISLEIDVPPWDSAPRRPSRLFE